MPVTIKHIVDAIEHTLVQHESAFQSIRLKDGFLGPSLFYLYYYQYSRDLTILQKVSHYLEKVFIKLSTNHVDDFDLIDLVELGRYIIFLNEKEICDRSSTITYLYELYPHIENLSLLSTKDKNLDSVNGLIAIGHYFIDAINICNYKDQIINIINIIESSSVVDKNNKNMIYWTFTYEFHHKRVIRFGTTNGICGVITFLLRAYKNNIHPEKCSNLINKATNYIKSFIRHGVNLFPFGLEGTPKINFQSMAYGDIGIGWVLYNVGKTFNNNILIWNGLQTIDNAAQFRDEEAKYIKDAALLHGASGLFSLFQLIEASYTSTNTHNATCYWLNKVVNLNKHNTAWAGYNSYYNGFSDYYQLSFAYGICGIGISLICHDLKLHHDYLRFFNFNI